jgi:hypothetical protein
MNETPRYWWASFHDAAAVRCKPGRSWSTTASRFAAWML